MIETFEITSMSDFIETIEAKEKGDIMLFRGQVNDDSLLPKIARQDPFKDTAAIEQKMIKDLSRRSNEFVQSNIKSVWDWLALGQHYGMSTRLLDWTTNPLIALWFACNTQQIRGSFSVVWIFLVPDDAILDIEQETTPFNAGKTKVFQPNLVGKRLSTQLGWFTVHKYSFLAKPHRFVGLEQNPNHIDNLYKLTIPNKIRKRLLEDLDTCGINASTVFPELDGLCQHINWQYLNG